MEIGLPWTEKYRPKRLDAVIGHGEVIKRLKAYVTNRNVPNLLFSGPPGCGKCVVGDTPILLADGSITPIKEIVGDIEQNKLIPAKNIEVMSLNKTGKFEARKVSHIYKSKKKTIRITTESGKTVETTPEHPLLTNENGRPIWVNASKLKKGCMLATPRSIMINKKQQKINFIDDKNLRILNNKIMLNSTNVKSISFPKMVTPELSEWLA
ncbi:MAG: hypothetical protein JXA43_03650, partial [Candidatus Diapherotrites archaeon]|nr:hypothetical protein [Candidatus Diapherotrites archaeon]